MVIEGDSKPEDRPDRANTPVGMFIRDLPEGTKLKLVNGALVEVVANANDGGWLLARYLENPDEPELEETEDWVFFGEVQEQVE